MMTSNRHDLSAEQLSQEKEGERKASCHSVESVERGTPPFPPHLSLTSKDLPSTNPNASVDENARLPCPGFRYRKLFHPIRCGRQSLDHRNAYPGSYCTRSCPAPFVCVNSEQRQLWRVFGVIDAFPPCCGSGFRKGWRRSS